MIRGALIVVLAGAGCSLLVRTGGGVPDQPPARGQVNCDNTLGAAFADAMLAVASGVTGVAAIWADDANPGSETKGIATGIGEISLAIGAVFLASAIYGHSENARCNRIRSAR